MKKSITDGREQFQEHQSRIWDTISFRTTRPILLTGVGVFTPVGSDCWISYVDARPIEEPLRQIDVKTKLDSEYGDSDKSTITIFSKVNKTCFLILMNCHS